VDHHAVSHGAFRASKEFSLLLRQFDAALRLYRRGVLLVKTILTPPTKTGGGSDNG